MPRRFGRPYQKEEGEGPTMFIAPNTVGRAARATAREKRIVKVSRTANRKRGRAGKQREGVGKTTNTNIRRDIWTCRFPRSRSIEVDGIGKSHASRSFALVVLRQFLLSPSVQNSASEFSADEGGDRRSKVLIDVNFLCTCARECKRKFSQARV